MVTFKQIFFEGEVGFLTPFKYVGWGVELLGLYLFGSAALFFTGGGKYAFSSSSRWD